MFHHQILFLAVIVTVGYAQTETYSVDFTVGGWNAANYPIDYPSASAHFSPLVGMVHDGSTSLYSIGSSASDGFRDVAETGNPTDLNTEMDGYVSAGSASSRFNFGSPSGADFSTSGTLTVTSTHSKVDMVTMIAPSPDWVAAVTQQDMWDSMTSTWKDCVKVTPVALDAGTDDGSTYGSADATTMPRGVVSELYGSGNAIWSDSTQAGVIGSVTFRRSGVASCPIPSPSPLPAPVMYSVDFTVGGWNAANYPIDYPSASAHFSPLVGMVHDGSTSLYSIGSSASDGFRDVAETGNPTDLNTEMDGYVSAGSASSRFNFGSPSGADFSTSGTLTVTSTHSKVDMVTMIAPSPDWVAAVTQQDMWDSMTSTWKDCVKVTLVALDAGTDDESTYGSADATTMPRGVVSELYGSGNAIWSDSTQAGVIGSVTFRRSGVATCPPTSNIDNNNNLSNTSIALLSGGSVIIVAAGVAALWLFGPCNRSRSSSKPSEKDSSDKPTGPIDASVVPV